MIVEDDEPAALGHRLGEQQVIVRCVLPVVAVDDDEPVPPIGDRLGELLVSGEARHEAIAGGRDASEGEVRLDRRPRRWHTRHVDGRISVGLDLVAGERIDDRESGVDSGTCELSGDADDADPEKGADLEHLAGRWRKNRDRSQLGQDVRCRSGEAPNTAKLELDEQPIRLMQRDGHRSHVTSERKFLRQRSQVVIVDKSRDVATGRTEQQVETASKAIDNGGELISVLVPLGLRPLERVEVGGTPSSPPPMLLSETLVVRWASEVIVWRSSSRRRASTAACCWR